MRGARGLADFVGNPFDAYVVRPGFLFWQRGRDLSGVRCHGRMTDDVVDELFRAYAADAHPAAGPHVSIADFRGITDVSLPTMERFRQRLCTAMPGFVTKVTKRLLVRPAGAVGIGIAGVRDQVPALYPVKFVETLEEGLGWLGLSPREPILGWLAAMTARLEHPGPARAATQEKLARGHRTLAACARATGQSTRSLQRHLLAEGTSFREERLRFQLAAAERLLVAPGGALSLAEIARAAGFATQAHFTNAFRRAYLTTPAAYRDASARTRSAPSP